MLEWGVFLNIERSVLSKGALSENAISEIEVILKNHLDTKMHVNILVFKVFNMNYIGVF